MEFESELSSLAEEAQRKDAELLAAREEAMRKDRELREALTPRVPGSAVLGSAVLGSRQFTATGGVVAASPAEVAAAARAKAAAEAAIAAIDKDIDDDDDLAPLPPPASLTSPRAPSWADDLAPLPPPASLTSPGAPSWAAGLAATPAPEAALEAQPTTTPSTDGGPPPTTAPSSQPFSARRAPLSPRVSIPPAGFGSAANANGGEGEAEGGAEGGGAKHKEAAPVVEAPPYQQPRGVMLQAMPEPKPTPSSKVHARPQPTPNSKAKARTPFGFFEACRLELSNAVSAVVSTPGRLLDTPGRLLRTASHVSGMESAAVSAAAYGQLRSPVEGSSLLSPLGELLSPPLAPAPPPPPPPAEEPPAKVRESLLPRPSLLPNPGRQSLAGRQSLLPSAAVPGAATSKLPVHRRASMLKQTVPKLPGPPPPPTTSSRAAAALQAKAAAPPVAEEKLPLASLLSPPLSQRRAPPPPPAPPPESPMLMKFEDFPPMETAPETAREGDLLGLSPGDMLSKSSWAATLTAMGPATASPSAGPVPAAARGLRAPQVKVEANMKPRASTLAGSHGLLASPPAPIFSDLTAAPLAQERATAGLPPQPRFDESRGREDEMLAI